MAVEVTIPPLESSNILIGYEILGSTSESHKIRIGATGSGTGQQNLVISLELLGLRLVEFPTPAGMIIDTSTGQIISSATPFETPWSDQSLSVSMMPGFGYFLDAAFTATLPTAPKIGSHNPE